MNTSHTNDWHSKASNLKHNQTYCHPKNIIPKKKKMARVFTASWPWTFSVPIFKRRVTCSRLLLVCTQGQSGNGWFHIQNKGWKIRVLSGRSTSGVGMVRLQVRRFRVYISSFQSQKAVYKRRSFGRRIWWNHIIYGNIYFFQISEILLKLQYN